LTSAGSNYLLQVGEVAKIDFTNTTSQPLRIATQNGTYYEMHLIPSNTGGTSGATDAPIFLNPNDTTYSGSFYYAQVIMASNGLGSSYLTYSNFRIGHSYSSITIYITNRNIYKNIKGFYDRYGRSEFFPAINIFSTDWRNTTTAWTILGTVVFPQSSSGTILVRRLL
jgi:hypothetical protein